MISLETPLFPNPHSTPHSLIASFGCGPSGVVTGSPFKDSSALLPAQRFGSPRSVDAEAVRVCGIRENRGSWVIGLVMGKNRDGLWLAPRCPSYLSCSSVPIGTDL